MILPDDFQFSQGSLQDYVDCSRRFQLRYVRRLRWPAVEMEPALQNERHLRRGAAFHRLIRQHLMGMPVETLSPTVASPELRRWWSNYLESEMAHLPSWRYPEVRLSTPVGNHRLVAQYDLVVIDPSRQVLIVDWKTNRKRPRRDWLSERLQTHVYPYVVVQAGGSLGNGTPIQPDQLTMIYWFANFPSAPERFTYDADQYRVDETYLLNLVEEIEECVGERAEEGLLPRTEDRERCSFCRYRSLCRRGVDPGWSGEAGRGVTSDESLELSLDFEQIAELDAG